MSKDRIKELKKQIADTRFYLGMVQHALKGYHPHPGHEQEVLRLSEKLADQLIELAKLGGHE
jgi:hypothetical protein